LLESNHQRRYFPFAATGINITAFIMELCNNYHLHGLMVESIGHITLRRKQNDETTFVAIHQNVVHEQYCLFFVQFCELWVQRDPEDCMSFPAIFREFKASIKKKYRRL
jgi:hypothetical protein